VSAPDETSRVLARIRKLLSLAKSDNVNEAEAALAQAHKLMDEHRISLDEVERVTGMSAERVSMGEDPTIARAKRHAQWRTDLFAMLCKHNGCRSVRIRLHDESSEYTSMGRESDRLMTRFMYDFAVRAIQRLAGERTFGSRNERNSYRYGVVRGIENRLYRDRKVAAQMEEHRRASRSNATALASSTSALTVIDSRLAAVEKYIADVHPDMTTRKTSMPNDIDMMALSRGMRDGENVRMPNRPLGAPAQTPEIGGGE
jgi:hypothetical protein